MIASGRRLALVLALTMLATGCPGRPSPAPARPRPPIAHRPDNPTPPASRPTQPPGQPPGQPTSQPASQPATLATAGEWDREEHGPSPHAVHPVRRGKGRRLGLVLPYPLTEIIKRVGKCRRGRRGHVAIDIGGAGPHAGLGTPIRAVTGSRVTYVGNAELDPNKHGRLDRRPGKVKRRRRWLPRSLEVPGYGRVYFFTLDYGRARAGHMVITKVLGGPLDGYEVRYIHLGALHPRIKVGARLAAGDEIGLMGGTAILSDLPHLHLDLWNRRGRRVDIGPFLGLPRQRVACPRTRRRRKRAKRKRGRRRPSQRRTR